MKHFIGFTLLMTMNASLLKADLGPKPKIELIFDSQNDFLPSSKNDESFLILCETKDCVKPRRLERMGPQHFSCHYLTEKKIVVCDGLAYGFSEYLQLEIIKNNKSIKSNVFKYSKQPLKVKFLKENLHVLEN
jgi:hypothetical protein